MGDIFRAPGQAEVLRRIAAEGRVGFYEGEVAEDMVAALAKAGGAHVAGDFAATACEWGKPVSGGYKGTDLLEHPPNGQGATAILLSRILARFDLASMDPLGADRAHLEIEATKLAYDARNRFVADTAHAGGVERMLRDETADALAALIDPRQAMASPADLAEAVHRDTIYITVVDEDRLTVSLIYSIFHSFGSGLVSPKFGILFHNRGAGFTLAQGHPNEIGGGKRPMHTIIPAMLANDGVVGTAFGVMGGQYQATGHAQFLTNLVDFGMNPQSAIDAPRIFWEAGEVKAERGYSRSVCEELTARGHKVKVPDAPIGGAQAIRLHRERGILEGASDPRKDGCALGY